MPPVVSFVIPVRNDAVRLERCLRSIRANAYPPERIEIVVVDNGSTDASADVARSLGATVLSLPRLRLGALRNQGVAATRGEIIAFVDADHEIVPGWIAAAVDALGTSHAAAGDACIPPRTPTRVQKLYDWLRTHASGQRLVEWLGSGNMAVRRSAFDAAGGFDESLETCEDVVLCRKLRAAGHTIVGDARLENIHYGDPTTLSRVFLGEMWRGRDNVRVSLRPPRTLRTLVSAAIPAVTLVLLAVAVVGLLTFSFRGLVISLAALGAVIVLLAARTNRMVSGRGGLRDWPGAFSVAAAYELGRAFAVAGPVSYSRRRKSGTS